VGPACQRLSRHAPCPDWLPGAALPSRPCHKGVDPFRPAPVSEAPPVSERATLTALPSAARYPSATPPPLSEPTAVLTGKCHRAAFCSEAGRRASLPSVVAPHSPCRVVVPHAAPPPVCRSLSPGQSRATPPHSLPPPRRWPFVTSGPLQRCLG
jgi:hypothetical protein